MGTLTTFGVSPFDILFRNFFESDGEFAPFNQIRFKHPVDIYEVKNGLNIDIACVGLTKKDIDLTIEGDVLRVEYKKIKTQTMQNIYNVILLNEHLIWVGELVENLTYLNWKPN